jgi:hypothetical protein
MTSSKQAFDGFREKLEEKQFIELELLRRFYEIKEFVLSELSKWYSLVFYIASTIITYFITTAERTKSARFMVYFMLILNAFIERMITLNSFSESDNDLKSIRMISEEIDRSIWLCRYAFITLSFSYICICAYSYKDFLKLSHSTLQDNQAILQQIRQESTELKQLMLIGISRQNSFPTMAAFGQDSIDHPTLKLADKPIDEDFSCDNESLSDNESESENDESEISEAEVKFHLSSEDEFEEKPFVVTSPAISGQGDNNGTPKYSLRPRRQRSSWLTRRDDLIETEDEFMAKVLKKSLKESTPRRKTVRSPKSPGKFFSSDDDN